MNAKQALAQARKRWGNKAAVEDRKKDHSDETRAAAKAEADALKVKLDAMKRGDPAISEMNSRYKKARSQSWQHRYHVGRVESMCGLGMFFIMGQGDSWQEAFDAADKSYPAKRAA